MTAYRIIIADDVDQLTARVNEACGDGWTPTGGPFLRPYAPGHGAVIAIAPLRAAVDPAEGWIYVDFCQALTREAKP